MNCLLCEKRTVYLYRRKSVKRLHNCLVRDLQRLVNGLALYKLRCHTAGCHSSAAAECLELAVTDNLVLINIEIHTHDIAALCISDGADTACVLNLSYISRVLKMIHNLFTIHNIYLLSFLYYLFFLMKSSYSGDISLKWFTISFKLSTT